MSQQEKSAAWRFLKEHGVTFDRHYRDYTTEELQAAADKLARERNVSPPPRPEPELPTERRDDSGDVAAQIASLAQTVNMLVQLQLQSTAPAASAPHRPAPPPLPTEQNAGPAPQVKPLAHDIDPRQHAGVTSNTHTSDNEIIEVDEFGNQWLQREVTKPAYPKPRGRRVLRTMEPGVVKETIKVGEYTETFEVAGDPRNAQPTEIKVTLPSYQTGIYRAPNMPFKIHTYNGVRGFDLRDVQEYYGGSDLVPDTIKKMYVSTDLCYDIQSTIRTIEDEYRERVLNKERLQRR